MFIDSHTHFDIIFEKKDISATGIFKSLEENNISNAVQVAIDVDNLDWSYNFAKQHQKKGIYCTLGLHPNARATEADLLKLKDTIKQVEEDNNLALLFGIGECGLDYYRLRQPNPMQLHSFNTQIELANKLNKPVIIHSRNAMQDTIQVLKEIKPNKGIMHCFPGDSNDAKQILDLGLMISFAGNVTYKNAKELHDSANYVPIDSMLLETDAPFLTPVPYRGKKNRPEFVKHTYKFIADLKNISVDTLKEAVFNNFNRIIQK